MSSSEKTHMVVILLVVLGGFAVLGCVVFAGFSLFVISGPVPPKPALAVIPTQAKSVSSTNGFNILQVDSVVRTAPGQYEVTVINTEQDSDQFDSYDFLVEKVATPNSTVSVKSQASGDPLPAVLKTVLLVKTSLEHMRVTFSYKVTKISKSSESIRSASLIVDLRQAKDGKAATGVRAPKVEAPAPK